jgi:hypothetical protein
VHLIGWGALPYYEKNQHTLHWAKLLRFGDGLSETLNYNVRVLGRKGVLVFNAIAERWAGPGQPSSASSASGPRSNSPAPGMATGPAFA